MSRGNVTAGRCLTVWVGATTGLVLVGGLAGGTAVALARPATWQRSFEELLVAVCAAVLLVCAARLWLVTTATTVALLRGRAPREARGLTRRLVLAACGAAVVAGVAAPATAGQGGDLDRLAGLPLPDRATAGSVVHHAPASRPAPHPVAADSAAAATPASGVETPPGGRAESRPHPASRTPSRPPRAGRDEVVVRSGDSLWSLAAACLPRAAGPAEVERAWREVYAANRAEIGPDPGLIRPGQRLRLPMPMPMPDEHTDR